MPTYEQNKAFIKQYMTTQDEIRVRMPKETGLKEAVQNHAKQTGESVNKFVVRAIMETMQRDLKPIHNMDDGVPPAIQAFLEEYKKAGE